MEKIRQAVTEIWVPQVWQPPAQPPARPPTHLPARPPGPWRQYPSSPEGWGVKSYWERKRDDSLMLVTICHDTWNMLNMQHITPNQKDGIIQTSLVVAIKRLKDPSTWLKVEAHNSHPRSWWKQAPGSAFFKPDQLNPWIKDQLGNDLLSTILPLQLPHFMSCGRDSPPTWHKIW